MKTKHIAKKSVALVLCMALLISTFTGCSSSNVDDGDNSTKDAGAEASEVYYRINGSYTTTVSLTNMKWSDNLNVDGVSVAIPDAPAYDEEYKAATGAVAEAITGAAAEVVSSNVKIDKIEKKMIQRLRCHLRMTTPKVTQAAATHSHFLLLRQTRVRT